MIRDTLRRQLPDADLPNDGSLVEFLSAATKALGQILLIILDQFEEFFIRLSPEFRAAFIKELGEVYDARDVPVKVLFSLREDWLASMDEIAQRIPDIFGSRLRISRLTRAQAQQAITEPVKPLGISYEPQLLEQLLEDLLGHEQKVMPPQLQMICNALYEDAQKKDEQEIKLATYEQLGGIQGLLRKYLQEELSRLDVAEQALADAVLEELITSEKTKAVKNRDELALGLKIEQEQEQETLKRVLKRLVDARLLRKDKTGQSAYELAHEYLIKEIRLSAESEARKEAEELIQQEVANWQRFGTVLAADKLAVVNQQRQVLRTGDEAQALLLHSALQVGLDAAYWLKRISDPTRRVSLLLEASESKEKNVRQQVMGLLGSQDVPQAVEPLVSAALHDENPTVREVACESLAKLTTQHSAIVERLIGSLAANKRENTTPPTRRAVLRVLNYLPFNGLPLNWAPQIFLVRMIKSKFIYFSCPVIFLVISPDSGYICDHTDSYDCEIYVFIAIMTLFFSGVFSSFYFVYKNKKFFT